MLVYSEFGGHVGSLTRPTLRFSSLAGSSSVKVVVSLLHHYAFILSENRSADKEVTPITLTREKLTKMYRTFDPQTSCHVLVPNFTIP